MGRIITETMSYFDIIKVFEEDLSMLNNKLKYVAKKYCHQLKINKKQCVMSSNISGNRGFHYFVLLCNSSFHDLKNYGLSCKVVAFYHSSNGLVAIELLTMVSKEILSGIQFSQKSYVIYETHFFDRYRERILGDKQLQKLDVMKQFFKTHINSMSVQQKDERYPNGIYVPINEGMCIGYQLGENVVVMKTCVSNEQMHNEQKDIHTICEEIMKNTKIDPTMCITRL